jgi:hypothetical protein
MGIAGKSFQLVKSQELRFLIFDEPIRSEEKQDVEDRDNGKERDRVLFSKPGQ